MDLNPVALLLIAAVSTLIWVLILHAVIKSGVRSALRDHQDWLDSRNAPPAGSATVAAAKAKQAAEVQAIRDKANESKPGSAT